MRGGDKMMRRGYDVMMGKGDDFSPYKSSSKNHQ